MSTSARRGYIGSPNSLRGSYGSTSNRYQAGMDTFRSTTNRMQPMHRITPYNTGYVGHGKVCTFAQPTDDFDIHELDFTPPPRVTTIPKRIRPGKKTRFKVPEQGNTDDRVPCRFCGRKFASDRIRKHESVCAGACNRLSLNKKPSRYTYDPALHAKMSPHPRHEYKSTTELIDGKPRWKIVHEELVAALRKARGLSPSAPDPYRRAMRKMRQPQGRVKASQRPKLTAMPTDRIECPYCHRRFCAETARTHIPKCPAQYQVPTRGGRRFK